MRIFILIIFLICIWFDLLKTEYKFSNKITIPLFILILVILIIAAGLRDGYHGYRDYINYVNMYRHRHDDVEFTFNIIANFSKWIAPGNIYVLFMIYAILGVAAKSIGIFRLTPFIFASLAMYVSQYYWLHELTQIRAGVASGLGLIAIKEIYDKNLIKYLLLIGLAMCFHTSAAIYLPLYFLKGDSFNKIIWICGGIIAVIAIRGMMELFLSSVLEYSEFIERGEAFQGYAMNSSGEYSWNWANRFYMTSYFLCAVYIFFCDKIRIYNPYCYILIKIYIISILFLFTFGDTMPTAAERFAEMLDVVWIVLFPMIIYIIKPRIFGVAITSIIGMCYLYRMFFWGIIP